MSEWLEAPLAELADIRVSNVDKKTSLAEKAVKLCNYMDVYSNDYIRADIVFMESSATSAEIARFKVDHGDVMITKDSETPDDIGIPSVVIDQIENVVCGYHLALIKPKRELIDPVYLSKQLGTDRTVRYFGRYAAGSTRYGLSNGAIANTIIPLAPLANQKKIASILTCIDTAIEKTESLIAKYQKIKAGLMHDLFTRGVTADGKLRPPREQAPELYQETPVGWMPLEWVFTNCDKVCEKIIDCKNRTPPETPDGHPVIRTPNVRNGEFVDNQLLFTNSDSYMIWTARGKPQSGDKVITREAPVGEVCMIPGRHIAACLGQRMMLYRPNVEIINPLYFLYALQSRLIQGRLNLISGGSTVGHVRVGDIRELWMVMPKSLNEQDKIASSLNAISEKIRLEKQHRDKLQSQKIGLMHDLLTGKVPVKIEPDQEFA